MDMDSTPLAGTSTFINSINSQLEPSPVIDDSIEESYPNPK